MTEMKFKDYKLGAPILKSLDTLGYEQPTVVQSQVIPVVLEDKDCIVASKTGSGKTASFAIPICEKTDWEENDPQTLVLTPTRELAMQIQEDFFQIGRYKRIKSVALYGKAPFIVQEKQLKQKTHVVVATPGRVIDHLEKGTWCTDKIRYLVIDEADEMLRMGFIEAIQTIIGYLPKKRVTLLFSATMPDDIKRLAETFMNEPVEVKIQQETKKNHQISESYLEAEKQDKKQVLMDLLVAENPESCMIFCNTKDQVDTLYKELRELSFPCMKLHGGLEQRERKQIIDDYKKGYFRYLIATDVAARGIDIDHISHVINYDVPEDKENYVHRIGRTGRHDKEGQSITLVSKREVLFLKSIENYTHHKLEAYILPAQEVIEERREAFWQKSESRIEITKKTVDEDIMKLHINAGKKTKMRPVDIVGTLCNIQGMTADDIGIINVLDVSTFVEVLNGKGHTVLKALQHTPIKGRLRRVTREENRE